MHALILSSPAVPTLPFGTVPNAANPILPVDGAAMPPAFAAVIADLDGGMTTGAPPAIPAPGTGLPPVRTDFAAAPPSPVVEVETVMVGSAANLPALATPVPAATPANGQAVPEPSDPVFPNAPVLTGSLAAKTAPVIGPDCEFPAEVPIAAPQPAAPSVGPDCEFPAAPPVAAAPPLAPGAKPFGIRRLPAETPVEEGIDRDARRADATLPAPECAIDEQPAEPAPLVMPVPPLPGFPSPPPSAVPPSDPVPTRSAEWPVPATPDVIVPVNIAPVVVVSAAPAVSSAAPAAATPPAPTFFRSAPIARPGYTQPGFTTTLPKPTKAGPEAPLPPVTIEGVDSVSGPPVQASASTLPIPPLPAATPVFTLPPEIARQVAQLVRSFVETPDRAPEAGAPPVAPIAQPQPVFAAPPQIAAPVQLGFVDTIRAEWMQTMIERIAEFTQADGKREAQIRLTPDTLGTIDVKIVERQDRLNVTLTTDNAQTRQLLSEAAPRLHELAEARGLKLGQTGVGGGEPQDRRPAPDHPQTPFRPRPASAGTDTPAATGDLIA